MVEKNVNVNALVKFHGVPSAAQELLRAAQESPRVAPERPGRRQNYTKSCPTTQEASVGNPPRLARADATLGSFIINRVG